MQLGSQTLEGMRGQLLLVKVRTLHMYRLQSPETGFLQSRSCVVKTSFWSHSIHWAKQKRHFYFGNLKYFYNFYGSSEKWKVLYGDNCILVSIDNCMCLLCSMCWTNWFFLRRVSPLLIKAMDSDVLRHFPPDDTLHICTVNMKVFPDHKNGTLFSAAKVQCMQCYALCVYIHT